MSDKIILDLKKPLLKTWSSESHLMSMILQQENAREWILNNYTNLIGKTRREDLRTHLTLIPGHDPTWKDSALNAWTGCPFLEMYYISHYYIKEHYGSILDYAIRAMEQGFYLYLGLRQDKLKTRMSQVIHKTFLYGFDKREQKLFVSDHYAGGKYALSTMEFSELSEAYEAAYWNVAEEEYNLSKQDLLSEEQFVIIARPKAFQYQFQLKWFQLQLEDYLKGTYSLHCANPLSFNDNYEHYWGIACYDMLEYYLSMLLQCQNLKKMDWRCFTLLCDHKTLLRMRAVFFAENGICNLTQSELAQYTKLSEKAQGALNLFLKSKISGNRVCLERLKRILSDMKNVEEKLLEELMMKII